MVIADALGYIRRICIDSGACHDSTLLKVTFKPFFDFMAASQADAFIFADRGFALRPQVLTPYREANRP